MGDMIFLLLIIALVIIFITHTFWKSKNLPPGPWGIPIIGYLPWINPTAPHLTLTELSKKYGKIYSISLGRVQTIVISDVKLLKSLFSKEATTCRAPLYLTHGIMNGCGIICAEIDLWKDQRKFVCNWLRNIGATKNGAQKEQMENLITKHANSLIQDLNDENLNNPIDPLNLLRHNIGSFITEITFGKCWSKNNQIWNWLLEVQEEGLKLMGVAGPLNFLPFLRFLPMFKRAITLVLEGQRKSHQLYQNFIDEELERQNNLLLLRGPDTHLNKTLIQGFLTEKEKRRNTDEDFNKYYNDRQLCYLMADIFGAAFDSTLGTLRWLLLYLAINEEVQNEARKEICTILGTKTTPCADHLRLMPFIEACIAETQRIRSIVPLGLPHGVNKDTQVEEGYILPKGCMIVPLLWAIHMDEEFYNNPNEFNPKNFLDDEGKFTKNENFIPFQIGKRICVGEELARTILFTFCVKILQNFTFTIADKENVSTEGEAGIMLPPKPYKIKFEKIVN